MNRMKPIREDLLTDVVGGNGGGEKTCCKCKQSFSYRAIQMINGSYYCINCAPKTAANSSTEVDASAKQAGGTPIVSTDTLVGGSRMRT